MILNMAASFYSCVVNNVLNPLKRLLADQQSAFGFWPFTLSLYRENTPGGGRICGLYFHVRGWLGLFWSSHADLAFDHLS